ncbi:hypothetical protein JKP75_13195 [Blastococcus sp. TML/M2B]|uniref:hypothetical protein n=1 Tax=unclassified Blastococcus TaxID=2619396 RepID=UPI00190A27E3|nr:MULTISPECIES: hypothetical protein [unclassified Blastococcus]MBN1093433.1 hypothetical protein [Blastococcus sp. TML/M2B]MBN1096449.1 hypothetical protein [Blastococcus sp. TML/C7B]
MITHDQLKAALERAGAQDVTDKQDRKNSISSTVMRCRLDGRRTVAVASGASTETCIGAVLDLLDLHLHGAGASAGEGEPAGEVAVVLGERENTEALDAIGSLLAAMSGGPAVHIYTADATGLRQLPPLAPADFSTSAKAVRYLGLMDRLEDGPPDLLRRLQKEVGRTELRAYPMLTGYPDWSLRLEGLEVGRIRAGRGWLDVGKVGRTGNEGEARRAWRAAAVQPDGGTRLIVRDDDEQSVKLAVAALTAFADDWFRAPAAGAEAKQNEHALESRILRGACPIGVTSGRLELLQPDDGMTNWGSQFPTRWGHTTGNAARYLDALMRQGSVPWAVEMKVRGGGGVGGYYRHAVAQAVLYRQFIRSASPLDPWFSRHGLDRTAVRAAVAVPVLDEQPVWRDRLQGLCDLMDVELVQVPHEYAALR